MLSRREWFCDRRWLYDNGWCARYRGRDPLFFRRPTGFNRVPAVSRLVLSEFPLSPSFNIRFFMCALRLCFLDESSSSGRYIHQQCGSFDRPRFELNFGCATLMRLSRCYHPRLYTALERDGTALGILAAAAAYGPYGKASRLSARKIGIALHAGAGNTKGLRTKMGLLGSPRWVLPWFQMTCVTHRGRNRHKTNARSARV